MTRDTFKAKGLAGIRSARSNALHAPQQPVVSVFPTFDMRQAHILMHCIGLGLNEALMVDGEPVTSQEFEDVIRQLIRR